MPTENLRTNINELVNTVGNTVYSTIDLTGDKSIFYFTIALLIVAFIIFLVMSWIFHTLNKKEAACKKLDTMYNANSQHKTTSFFRQGNIKSEAKESNNPTNFFDNENKSLVKNYYIKTAYNACCGDGYKNNFVNKCALEKCIELGARCLDFEIYSYNGEPIVAASTANNNSIKETYNYIKLTDVFNILRDNCFHETKSSAGNDPMFLHFRIMSENKTIYDKFGDYIEQYLIKDREDNILDYVKYNYKNNPNDDILLRHLGSSIFNKKFIIMVNTLHVPILDNSKLSKYVHIRSGSKVLKLYRYEQVIAAGKNNPLMIDESHRSLIMVLPNIDNTLKNFDPLLPFNNGCQFVGMKFQNIDNDLVGYYKMFKDSGGFSFVLKPNNLRKDIIPPEEEEEGIAVETPAILTLENS
tara:strand:- start:44 stop:1279 length:1236 start_codon:yes stop_codon:yes gene_type:complete